MIEYKLHLEMGDSEDLRETLKQEKISSESTTTMLKEALAMEQTRIVSASLVSHLKLHQINDGQIPNLYKNIFRLNQLVLYTKLYNQTQTLTIILFFIKYKWHATICIYNINYIIIITLIY